MTNNQTKARMVEIRNRDYRALQSVMDQVDEDGQDAILDYLAAERQKTFDAATDLAEVEHTAELARVEAAGAAAAITVAQKHIRSSHEWVLAGPTAWKDAARIAVDKVLSEAEPFALSTLLDEARDEGLSEAWKALARALPAVEADKACRVILDLKTRKEEAK